MTVVGTLRCAKLIERCSIEGRKMAPPLLAVRGVTVSFAGLAALDQVSLEVGEREIVSLIGPNGAGKTTLFNVVCGFVRPSAGQVEFRGQELLRHRPKDLARMRIGRTLQGVKLWQGLTVLENVMAGAQSTLRAGLASALLGLPRSSREEASLRDRATSMLGRLGVADLAERLPASLPYGMQKRVAIARVLMMDPVLLLLDEPASGLSAAEMDELAAVVQGLRTDMGVLLVEHHMDFVMAISERVVVLNFGRVIAAGLPEEIRADDQVTTAYLGEQVRPDVDRTGSPTGSGG
jgi:branched-chain amino acid transport system ATP-binding protein